MELIKRDPSMRGGSNMEGLSSAEAKRRLIQYGENRLQEQKKKSVVQVFLLQFKNLLVMILLIAAAISVCSNNTESALVILLVILLNAVLGTLQMIKARDSLDALKRLSAPKAKVFRDGSKVEIDASEVVPGDLLLLEAGDIVAADGKIIQNHSIKVNESALTGESVSIDKAEMQENELYSGSIVTYGRAEAEVIATGMHTKMGEIAALLGETEESKTPLQISMDQFSRRLAIFILAVCVLVFAIGLYRNQSVLDSLLFAVALAVAAIPEALGAIVTIVQAIGTKKMVKENAIIKELKAVESLGCVSVICSDKTGTLTMNQMTVQEVFIEGSKKQPEELRIERKNHRLLLLNAILNNDSVLTMCENNKEKTIGDPTESCLLSMARKAGINENSVRMAYPRMGEIPFDSERKLMSAAYCIAGKEIVFTKGALEELLNRCKWMAIEESNFPLTEKKRKKILQENDQITGSGKRVLAFAYKEMGKDEEMLLEEDLVYLGAVSIMDPPRAESFAAVEDAKKAGIRTIMITGDYKTTAAAIARRIGILGEKELVLSGAELDQMSEEELENQLEDIRVYARVSPENKIRIVRAWQRRKAVVAMTGDGVNDAPALKQADIGISMGITGTEVAKDAAGIILADDNFATIIKAVANGRNVYRNIKNTIQFLLSGNMAAILTVLYTSFAGLPIPFAAVQLLFINLATDSLPAIAIGMEPANNKLLEECPRNPSESVLNVQFVKTVIFQGGLLAIATLFSYYVGLEESKEVASTMAFSTLTAARLFHGFNCHGRRKLFQKRHAKNPWIGIACLTGLCMLMAVLLIPGVQQMFFVVPVGARAFLTIFAAAITPTVFLQLLDQWKK